MKEKIIIGIIGLLFILQTVYFVSSQRSYRSELLTMYKQQEQRFRDSINARLELHRANIEAIKDSIQVTQAQRIESETRLNNQLTKLKQNVSYINYTIVSDSALLARLRSRN